MPPRPKAKTALLEAIRGYHDAMVDFTRQLIAIPTENPPGTCYAQARQLILGQLKELGFADTHLIGECILSFVGTGKRTLYFSGHYDVVPAQSAAQFEPRIKGENLIGRGSSDMKSGLAAMTFAAKALQGSGLTLNGRLGLVFVPDEETAGARGSRYLVQQKVLGQNAIGMLTPEPTGGVIWNANRGAITLKVTVKGKTAHVGRQHDGVNAFEQMLAVVQPVQELKREVEKRVTDLRPGSEATRQSILMIGGRSEAGTNFNAVPGEAWFTIDRRINPEENLQEEKQRLLSVLERSRTQGIDLRTEILQEGESAAVTASSSLKTVLTRSVQEITRRQPQIEMCPGLLETRFYAAKGIPAFAYGPGLLTVSHGPNEFVPIDRIFQCAGIYALTAAELLGA